MNIEYYKQHPLKALFLTLSSHGFLNIVPDGLYLRLKFYLEMGYWPNIRLPKTFNEKIQWLKLHNRQELHSTLVDKYAVKKYVSQKIGDEFIVPNLGLWKSFDEIDFNALPNQFVLKCTHDSGGLVICRDKSKLDMMMAKNKIEHCLNHNFYYSGREWPYKNVKPNILAEKYLEMDSGDVVDYKVHCFNGVARFILTCSERFSKDGLKEDFYDINWARMNVSRPNHPNSKNGIKRPEQLARMIEIAEIFAKKKPFLRVDFYEVRGQLYFGEFTFYPASGFEPFCPVEYDEIFGSWLKI